MKNAPLLAICDAFGPWHSMCSSLIKVLDFRASKEIARNLETRWKFTRFKAQKR